ncbi:MAG: MBL fold metallo-hydrolase [Alphaproteobacteria bacterium]|nr:MBL fold metallo-hydrolase [Alphaproteobacteria bacterium]
MIFRQLFEPESCTYTYLLASRIGGEALIIDSVFERVDRYVQLLAELDLKLVKVVDTHIHADHITGMGELRDRTKCITVMGDHSPVDVVSMRVKEGETIDIEGLSLHVMYTPGHTSDSYSFLMDDRVFTGDTLLIRGTGRTDFQNGDPRAQYDSLFSKLLTLPEDTLVYPAHDYKGDTVSTIAEEKAFNPRLQVDSVDQYVDIMENLNLANPKMMDIAVPANLKVGIEQGVADHAQWALTVEQVMKDCTTPDCTLIDLREDHEREKNGYIPGSIHAPYTRLDRFVKPGGMLREMAAATGKRLIYYCAYGERSALAVETSQAMGLENVCHLVGGVDAWARAGGDLDR